MGKSLKGTRTEKNLLAAFAGESQARNRYTYFASAARKEGYEQIANIFIETSENEKEHAKVFFKYLEGGDVEITAVYPAGIIKDNTVCVVAPQEKEALDAIVGICNKKKARTILVGEDIKSAELESSRKTKRTEYPILFIERGIHVYKG